MTASTGPIQFTRIKSNPSKDPDMITRDQRESFLDDVQILRNRQMTMVEIAKALGVDPKQVDRWAKVLKQERRWRTVIREYTPGGFILNRDTKNKRES